MTSRENSCNISSCVHCSGFALWEFSCVTTKLIPADFQFVSVTHRSIICCVYLNNETRESLSPSSYPHCNLQANWKSRIYLTRIIINIIILKFVSGQKQLFIYLFIHLPITSWVSISCVCICLRCCPSIFYEIRWMNWSEIDIDIGLLKATAMDFLHDERPGGWISKQGIDLLQVFIMFMSIIHIR